MNLTEFLKYTYPTRQEVCGEFLEGRRREFNYPITLMASLVDMTPRQYRRIETGEIPVPEEIVPILLCELKIEENEKKDFLDLVNLSRENWNKINKHITRKPYARKFLNLAADINLPDEVYKSLYYRLLQRCQKAKVEKADNTNDKDQEMDK